MNASRTYFIPRSLLPNPRQILGTNLAVWLQADIGIAQIEGAPVPLWPNQAGNGDAVQDGNPDPPVLALNSFGSRPGVSTTAAGNRGLVLTLLTAIAAGKRPYTWVLAKNNTTTGAFRPLLTLNDALFADFMYITGSDAVPGWIATINATNVPAKFANVASANDLLPHRFQLPWDASGLVIDGVASPLSGDPGVTAAPVDIITLGNATPQYGPGFEGFMNLGIVIMSFDAPTADQIARVNTWIDAYR